MEEQKSILSQLHRERQSLAEERASFSVSQKLQRDEGEEYNLKLSQVTDLLYACIYNVIAQCFTCIIHVQFSKYW